MDRPFRVRELDHVVLRCREQARTLAFYTEVLGLTEERRLDAIGLIQLRAGRSIVDLLPADERTGRGNMDHFCLDVEGTDMPALLAYLEAAGIELVAQPMRAYGAHGFGESVWVRDPERNVVELKIHEGDSGDHA